MLLIFHYETPGAPRGATPERMRGAIDVARMRWMDAVGDPVLKIIPGPSFTANVRILWDDTLNYSDALMERGRSLVEAPLANVAQMRYNHWWIRLNLTVRWGWTWFGRLIGVTVADVLTHEFGHVLGLPHSEDHRSVMWSGGNGLASHVGPMDVAAVKLKLKQS